mmetsp:Transcript_24822/g.58934  ORF Transcript_24822/g.58934 Transcript_24822/m.58934 type:complete len:282 (+) Transcript_24822:57-902(+)
MPLRQCVLAGVSSMASDECGALSFVQRQSIAISRPWESQVYWVGAHHKAGSHLLRNLMRRAFDGLGANYSCRVRGMRDSIITTEGGDHYCSDVPDCHIMWDNSAREESVEEAMTRGNGSARGVHIVRNPWDMLASDYCYHHRGEEPWNGISHLPEMLSMGPLEGTMTLWPEMSAIIDEMAQIFANKGLHHVRYEKLTESSASFDQQVNAIFEDLFGGLISRKEHARIAEAAKAEDLHRHIDAHAADHTNSDECMEAALEAQQSLDPSVKAHLTKLQVSLGY